MGAKFGFFAAGADEQEIGVEEARFAFTQAGVGSVFAGVPIAEQLNERFEHFQDYCSRANRAAREGAGEARIYTIAETAIVRGLAVLGSPIFASTLRQ